MNLVLMGPPGAGKGTQGEILSKRLDINTISTGVMLRTAIKEQSEIGKIAEKYINDGKLVPDDVIVSIVKERLQKPDCAKGFILDGFPRTTAQAEALTESGVKIDKVLSLEVADEAIIERLSSRRECSKWRSTVQSSYQTSLKLKEYVINVKANLFSAPMMFLKQSRTDLMFITNRQSR